MNTQRWNTKLLTEELICREFKERSERKLEEVCDDADTEELWSAIKGSIEEVATEVLGKNRQQARKQCMTQEILKKMEERRQYKSDTTEEGQLKYKELKHEVQSDVPTKEEQVLQRKVCGDRTAGC